MRLLTRNWLIGMVVGWTLLIGGLVLDSRWAIGASVVLFLVLVIERHDNVSRSRGTK